MLFHWIWIFLSIVPLQTVQGCEGEGAIVSSSYYTDPITGKCAPCKVQAECELGNVLPVPREDYWVDRSKLSNFAEENLDIVKCNRPTCKGGLGGSSNKTNIFDKSCWLPGNLTSKACDSDELQCLKGSRGPLCQSCDDKYVYDTSKFKCVECRPVLAYQEKMVMGAGILVLVLFISRWAMLNDRLPHWIVYSELVAVLSHVDSGSLKIVLSTYQIISSTAYTLNVRFPQPYARFHSALGFLAHSSISYECFSSGNDEPFFTKVYVVSIIPLILAGIIGAVGFVRLCFTLRRGHVARQTWSGLFIVAYIFIPPVVMVQLQGLDCIPISNHSEEKFLRWDTSISCEHQAYKQFLVYDALLIFVYVSMPLGLLTLLVKERDRLHPKLTFGLDNREDRALIVHMRSRDKKIRWLRPLFQEYKPKWYWYDIYDFYRRILFTGVLNFISHDSTVRGAAGAMFALMSLLILSEIRPFSNRLTNAVATVAQGVILLTFASAYAIENGTTQRIVQSWVGIFLLIVNLSVFVLGFAFAVNERRIENEVMRAQLGKVQRKIEKAIGFSATKLSTTLRAVVTNNIPASHTLVYYYCTKQDATKILCSGIPARPPLEGLNTDDGGIVFTTHLPSELTKLEKTFIFPADARQTLLAVSIPSRFLVPVNLANKGIRKEDLDQAHEHLHHNDDDEDDDGSKDEGLKSFDAMMAKDAKKDEASGGSAGIATNRSSPSDLTKALNKHGSLREAGSSYNITGVDVASSKNPSPINIQTAPKRATTTLNRPRSTISPTAGSSHLWLLPSRLLTAVRPSFFGDVLDPRPWHDNILILPVHSIVRAYELLPANEGLSRSGGGGGGGGALGTTNHGNLHHPQPQGGNGGNGHHSMRGGLKKAGSTFDLNATGHGGGGGNTNPFTQQYLRDLPFYKKRNIDGTFFSTSLNKKRITPIDEYLASMKEIRQQCERLDLVPLYHFTSVTSSIYINESGFRMSTQGQGDGGVYFSILSPASYGLGSKNYETNIIRNCFGNERLEEFKGKHKLDVCIVYAADPYILQQASGGRTNSKVVSKMTFESLSLHDVDAHYYLRPDRIFGVFYLMDSPIQFTTTSSNVASFNYGRTSKLMMSNRRGGAGGSVVKNGEGDVSSAGTIVSGGSTWKEFLSNNPQAHSQIQAEVIEDGKLKDKLNEIDKTMQAFGHQAEMHLESRQHFSEKSTPSTVSLSYISDLLNDDSDDTDISLDGSDNNLEEGGGGEGGNSQKSPNSKKGSGTMDYYNKMLGSSKSGGGGSTNQSKGLRKILSSLSQSTDSVKTNEKESNLKRGSSSEDINQQDDDLRGSFIMYESKLRKNNTNSHPRLKFAKAQNLSSKSSNSSVASSPITDGGGGVDQVQSSPSLSSAQSFPVYDDRLSVSGYVEASFQDSIKSPRATRPKSQSTPVEMISKSISARVGRRLSALTSPTSSSPNKQKSSFSSSPFRTPSSRNFRPNTPPLSSQDKTLKQRLEGGGKNGFEVQVDRDSGVIPSYLQSNIDSAEKVDIDSLDFSSTNHDVLL